MTKFCQVASAKEAPYRCILYSFWRGLLSQRPRASIAAKLANMPVGRNWIDSNSANLPNNKISQSQAADMMNVSERSVATAKKVQEEAIPEIKLVVIVRH